MTGEPRSSRLNSPAAEKWVCWEEPIGPESEAADWPSESLVQLLPEVAFWAVKPERAADVALGRHNSSRSPWNWLPPLLVMTFTTLPVLPPNSAEKALVRTSISCTEVSGRLLNMVWRPQASLPVLPSTTKVV